MKHNTKISLFSLLILLSASQVYAQQNGVIKKYAYETLTNSQDNPRAIQTLYKDLDQDGVPDQIDHCLNTGIGYPVDQFGCELDSDGDGVFNSLDHCPNTPQGMMVNFLGCEGDQDKDKVLDSKDKCPDTPLGTHVNKVGCKVDTDADNDGVINSLDLCPNTPLGTKVNHYGCQPKSIVVTPIVFDSASYRIRTDQKPILDASAGKLRELAGDQVILIVGHTDNIGSDWSNEKLSWNRAYSVKQYLVRNFNYDFQKIFVLGKGESAPIADNNTWKGRTQNRRIAFKILELKDVPKTASQILPESMKNYSPYQSQPKP